jgi:hypothetical protein
MTEADSPEQQIRIADIVPSLAYRDLDRATVDDLKISIAGPPGQPQFAKGLLEAIRVHPYLPPRPLVVPSGKFKVSFGDHRLQACKELGWETIRSVIGHGTEAQESMLGIVENVHRNEKVNVALMGVAFRRLMTEEHPAWDLVRCAKETNKTTAWVQHCLDIADLVDPVLHRRFGNLVPRSLASTFARVPFEDQARVLDGIEKRGKKAELSVDSIRMLIHRRARIPLPGAEVLTCDNCGGILPKEQAEVHRRGTDFFWTHKDPKSCEFNDTIVVAYNGAIPKAKIREVLEYAKGKLEDVGATVSFRWHWKKARS